MKWTSNLITVILVVAIIITIFGIIQSKKNSETAPSIMGYKLMWVLTGSMRPSIEPGDLVIVKDIKPEEVQVGQVITFKRDNSTLITHRVVDVIDEETIMFKTKGDANNVADSNLVQTSQLVGSLKWIIPKGGYVMNYMQTPKGLISFISFVGILLIIPELKTILSNKKV